MSTSPASERVEITPELLDSITKAAEDAAPAVWRACVGSASDSSWFDLASGLQQHSHTGESCKCRMVYGGDGPPVIYALSSADESFTAGEGVSNEQARANARHVASASPALVLALVERIRELESDNEELMAHLSFFTSPRYH